VQAGAVGSAIIVAKPAVVADRCMRPISGRSAFPDHYFGLGFHAGALCPDRLRLTVGYLGNAWTDDSV
jgi:hypothetical protein